MYNPEDYCSVRIFSETRMVGGHQCQRKWKIEEAGKKYCIQHSPAKVKERRVTWNIKYDVESKARKIKYALEYGRIKACKDVPVEYLKDGILRKLIDFAYEMNNEELIAELENHE